MRTGQPQRHYVLDGHWAERAIAGSIGNRNNARIDRLARQRERCCLRDAQAPLLPPRYGLLKRTVSERYSLGRFLLPERPGIVALFFGGPLTGGP